MKNNNLHNIESTGFKTPDGYFKALDDLVFVKLKEDTLSKKVNSSGFKLPPNYFETFNQKVLHQIENNEITKVVPLFSWKKVGYISGIAASILLIVNIFFGNSEKFTIDDLETASIENYLAQEDLNAYDIANYLNEDDLSVDSFTDATISEKSLEDYLLNNITIDDLITEQ